MSDNKDDIMGDLLNDRGDNSLPSVEELNCLIYRDPKDLAPLADVAGAEPAKSWQSARENVTVQIWESRANIKIRVAAESKASLSMNRIADIAVKAILEELKKEEQ